MRFLVFLLIGLSFISEATSKRKEKEPFNPLAYVLPEKLPKIASRKDLKKILAVALAERQRADELTKEYKSLQGIYQAVLDAKRKVDSLVDELEALKERNKVLEAYKESVRGNLRSVKEQIFRLHPNLGKTSQ